MLRTPGPYAAWKSWLEAFGRGEDLPFDHLPVIDEKMGPEMADRLLRQVAEAFHQRQRRWSEALRRDQQLLTMDPARAATTIAVVLGNARTLLAPLRDLTEHPRFPAELRKSLAEALEQTVRSAQRSLEDSARHAPIELQSAIRMNSLVPALTRKRPPARTPGTTTGRRVIL
ncbi:hypothetical protein [Umezawaea tangerina]|uniref:Uncharacterized protein n=1 Tax=Umezawaea tangerina TaxID=84725 RepID=A0A2T0SLI0_9PSEU|nr:hypothetical protein [Umezawaea tangerina]PRY34269.1 hypothetical protein CLV43_11742 [Umezawaea tangerina]